MTALQNAPAKIRLLGKFEIEGEGTILHANEWRRKKAADLLKRLAVEKRLVKDQAVEFLWPGSSLDSGFNNLYKTIYDLRQTIDSAFGDGSSDAVFQYNGGVLTLAPDVWVDVHEFEDLCKRYTSSQIDQQASLNEDALSLYKGELLPDDIYVEWTIPYRNELARLHREARFSLAQTFINLQKYTEAIQLLKPLIKDDPADELIHRELMRAFALSGRRHDAIRQYQACADALASELDAPPGPETAALYDRILNNQLTPPQIDPDSSQSWLPPSPVNMDSERSLGFAGRQKELKELTTILENARQWGRTILISGESGIGKTRLAMEILRFAAQNGMKTLMGAAYEQEGPMPFQPFIEAFDHYLAEQGGEQNENPIIHFQPLGSSDLQQEHWSLFRNTANFILDLARESGLAFLVDDLHAADETSIQLFHYLARQTRSAPVVLIATYRIDAPANAQFYPLVSALYREGLSYTISLESLNKRAIRKILEDILQGEVSEELCQAIYDVTAGNPFFTEEIAGDLIAQGHVEKGGGKWSLVSEGELRVPEKLSAFLYQKVNRLGNNLDTVLTTASVIGREFSFDVLEGMSGVSNGEIINALDTALAAHLVEETSVGYRFRHPLIRHTLYESLSRVRCAQLHRHAARAIEASYASSPDGISKQVEALAYHYDLSDRRDKALTFLVQSGEKAAELYAFEVAIDYFERALSLMDDLDRHDPALRWHLLESLGWWHGSILADTPRAVACFEQALEFERNEKQDWSPTNRDIVRAHCGAAVTLITSGDIEAAGSHLKQALSVMGDQEDASEYADLLYNLAQLHWHRNEYHQAMEAAKRSLAIAERLDKPDVIARAFEMLALACHSLGEWQQGITYEQQRAELTGAGLDVTDAFDVHL